MCILIASVNPFASLFRRVERKRDREEDKKIKKLKIKKLKIKKLKIKKLKILKGKP